MVVCDLKSRLELYSDQRAREFNHFVSIDCHDNKLRMSENQPLLSENKMYQQQPQQPGYPGQYPGVQPATYPGGQPSVYPGYQAGAPPPGAPPQGYGAPGATYPPQAGYPPPAGGTPGYPSGAPPPQGAGYPPPAQGPPPTQGAGVDEPTYKGDVPDEDVEVDPNAAQAQDSATPSAPPSEKMDHVAGYDHMNAPVPPPPSYQQAMSDQQPPQRQAVSSMPTVTEEQARDALVQYVSENCCFGSKAAQEMVFTDITHSSAFHYKLETFTEKRSTAWAYEPYRGQPVDGPVNGPAPGPWDIQVQIPGMFQTSKGQAEVPHTASVKPCHDCHGLGRRRCHVCLGRGRTRCHHCHGSGRVMVHTQHHDHHHGGHGHHGHHGHHHHHGGHHHAPCTWCHGLGRNRCHACFGHGQIKCKTCDGAANLKFYIKLDIDWTNHASDTVVERTALPDELIKGVTGEVAFKEEQPRVWPINHFPDQQINQSSHQLVNNHVSSYRMEKIVMQRHQVRIVPVAEAHYQWKSKIGSYYVYGFEHKVHAPDYPQQCCCGCNIL